jgi:CubicO group peptidase (beta-lactamase class C family)
VLGETFEDYVQEAILDPLGMSNSGFTFTPEVIANLAKGYQTDLIDLGWQAPAGQMYCSARDLAQLATLLFRQNAAEGETSNQILDGITIV